MNRKSLAALVILASLAGLLVFACEEKGADPVADRSVHKDAEPVVPEAVAGMEMQGRLEQTGSGELVLDTGQERYDLESDSNLRDLIGQSVRVTGTLATSGALRVTQVIPIAGGFYSQDEDSSTLDSINPEKSYTKESSNED